MQVFAKTDIGRERRVNEDFYYISEPEDKIKLFIFYTKQLFLYLPKMFR